MVYTKPLPKAESIERLARVAGSFPATAGTIRKRAKSLNFGRATLDFLNEFPDDEVFESRADFLTRTEELGLLMREERQMPDETLRSPEEIK